MTDTNKRNNWRVPLQIPVNEYVGPDTRRSLTFNLGPDGMYLNRLALSYDELEEDPLATDVVGLEFELPCTSEVIWAAGRVCHERADQMFEGTGVRFASIAGCHRTLINDYVQEVRIARLQEILSIIRRNRQN